MQLDSRLEAENFIRFRKGKLQVHCSCAYLGAVVWVSERIAPRILITGTV
jgi:hypothetical protein